MNDNLQKQYLHLVVSRVALKWLHNGKYRHEVIGYSWEDFVKSSINLYNNFCKKSLQAQSNKNFKLISLIDPSISNYNQNLLNNEVLVKTTGVTDIPNAINNYLKSLNVKYDYIVITRLDRDDALDIEYIQNVQNLINTRFKENKKDNYYFDVYDHLTYDIKIKKAFLGKLYQTVTSPFITTIEKYNDNIECIAYKYNHGQIKNIIKGEKNKNLKSLQVIHGKNILNKISGNKINIDPKSFGL